MWRIIPLAAQVCVQVDIVRGHLLAQRDLSCLYVVCSTGACRGVYQRLLFHHIHPRTLVCGVWAVLCTFKQGLDCRDIITGACCNALLSVLGCSALAGGLA